MTDSYLWQTLTLQNYNTRVVLLSTMFLGIAAGLVGSFLLLRKRSLMSDTLSHACLPGIAAMFMALALLGRDGKSLPMLLLGAILTGIVGVGLVLAIRSTTRLGDDASMGIVLSVFFGFGIALLSLVQQMPGSSAAGLENFIYGKTASMIGQDQNLLLSAALLSAAMTLLLLKEFTLVCFDDAYAASLGWPVRLLDAAMLGLVTLVTVAGLQAVGLILIIAFMITPAATARFWTHDYRRMVWIAAGFGAVSGLVGGGVSALFENLPAGAIIVLVASGFFLVSMVFGTSRGVLKRLMSQRRLRRKVSRQHLLRAVFELLENRRADEHARVTNQPVAFAELLAKRSWTAADLRQKLAQANREDHLELFDGKRLQLSESGFGEAARYTRNHRLWEIYLITFAEVAPQHVDRDADRVEHVLGAELVQGLEKTLERQGRLAALPPSPHRLNGEGAS